MVVFLDTSSLIKLYCNEPDSEAFITKIENNVSTIYLFELAKVEFTSALYKKARVKSITQTQASEIIKYFENDFSRYEWIVFDNKIIQKAITIFE